jgi:hypothetical protein
MARRLPIVACPLVTVLEREGVEVVLVSVEAWPDEVVVRMRGLPTELTARLDTEFHAALEAWHREGQIADAPRQPAERIFDVEISISDDLGTTYAPSSSSRGGSARMFRADWVFRPGPPEGADSLSVHAGGAEGLSTRIDLRSAE